MCSVSGAVNILLTLVLYFLVKEPAIAAPAAAPNKPTQESLIVPIISRRPVSIPAAGPRLTPSFIVLGATIKEKSTRFAPTAWFVAR